MAGSRTKEAESWLGPPQFPYALFPDVNLHQEDGDFRRKRYDVAGVLVVLVLAKLAGMKSVLGASEWIEDQATLLRAGLHLSWKRMPCANTYSYVLARLDSHKVNTVLAAWFVRGEAASAAHSSRFGTVF